MAKWMKTKKGEGSAFDTRRQCDQIGRFLKALGDKFLCKSVTIFSDLMGYF